MPTTNESDAIVRPISFVSTRDLREGSATALTLALSVSVSRVVVGVRLLDQCLRRGWYPFGAVIEITGCRYRASDDFRS